MQVTVCKPVTLAAKAPKMPGCVATGFPLPSTGRGTEGEGWSYPEPPPVRFFPYQHHPASRLKTLPKIPVISHLSLSTSHEPTPKHPRRNPQSMLSRGEHAPSRVSDRASRSEPMRAIARRDHAQPTSSCPQNSRNITFITLNSHENAPQRPPPVSLQHPSSSKALRIPET